MNGRRLELTDLGSDEAEPHGHAARPRALSLLVAAPSAWAGASFSVGPAVPSPVTVGDTGRHATSSVIENQLVQRRRRDRTTTTDNFQINTITLVPSCGSHRVLRGLPRRLRRPGAIVPSPLTGTGRAGTACAGRTFTIALDRRRAGQVPLHA